MSFHSIIQSLESFFHSIVSSLKPALDQAEKLGGEAFITLAETVIAGLAADAPWSSVVDAFIPAAEKAGRTLLRAEAGVILNLAKANLLAKQNVVA